MIAFPATSSPARRPHEAYLPLVEQAARSVARRCRCDAGEFLATGWVALTKLLARDDLDGLDNFESFAVTVLTRAMLKQRSRADDMVSEKVRARGVRMLSADAATGDEGDGFCLGSTFAGDEPDAGDAAAAADELLAVLPPVQRRIVELVDVGGATVGEAADALRMTAARVEELHRQALGLLRRTARMSQIKSLLGDPRFAEIVRAVAEREQDETKAAAEVRRALESAGMLDAFVDAAAVAAIRRFRGMTNKAPGDAGRAAGTGTAADAKAPGDAGRAARLAAMGAVGRTIVKSYLAEWRLPSGKPLGQATLAEVRRAAASERNAAVLKLEDAEFLRSVGDLGDDELAKVSAVATERQLDDLFNAARRMVTYQTTPRVTGSPGESRKIARQIGLTD